MRLLLVDDDAAFRELLRTTFEDVQVEVDEAGSAAEAEARIGASRPDVIVLDVGMPGMDGLEVLAAIRADEALAGTRVLLLTAKAQESDVRRGYQTGADAYVKKPFSPAELAGRVRELYGDGDGAR